MLIHGCDYPASGYELANPNVAEFEESVYPVLLRDCGFAACHGDPERFFQVFGPGRERLSEQGDPYASATVEELALSFTRARSMLGAKGQWKDALLLRKPLARSAGGAGHGGEDPWKQNVYATKREPGYQALESWARSMVEVEGRTQP